MPRNARARPEPGPRHLTLLPPPRGKCAVVTVARGGRFGQPSTFGLTRAELERHIRQLNWQAWEIAVRFDLEGAA
jgi:hypothetical protein